MSCRCPAVALLTAALLACSCGAPAPPAAGGSLATASMVRIAGGSFHMGTDQGFPYEGPVHEVRLQPFAIDRHEVTVGEFARFVEATGYRTEAEGFGWSGAFDAQRGEWTKVDGASWREPEGPGRRAQEREPVTQVSWNDAVAFCRWRGGRLPTEAEFELAARGGLEGRAYGWGDELLAEGRHHTNVYQGSFPLGDEGEDGFVSRAPVESFPPNGLGLYDMTGNVWEWTADWYDPGYYAESPRDDPRGPATGEARSIRGGSFLCSENYCTGYRVAARSQATPDSGLNSLGFRCAG